MKSKILLVDDDESILSFMRRELSADYDVFTSSEEEDALRIFQRVRPAVVLLDLSLKPGNPSDLGGLRLLERVLDLEPSTRVIVITGDNRDANALRAVGLGAWDFYTKPVPMDELKVMIRRAVRIYRFRRRVQMGGVDYSSWQTGINLKSARRAMEKDFVKKALARNRGVVSRAARELGVSRVNLYDLMQKYDISLTEFKAPRARAAQFGSTDAY